MAQGTSYWASFRNFRGHLLRFDTRIYLKPTAESADSDVCIGCTIGKNPGSARPIRARGSSGRKRSSVAPVCGTEDKKAIYTNTAARQRQRYPLALGTDRFLPTVRATVLKAYVNADVAIPERGYLSVLNLFYLCEARLAVAKKHLDELPKTAVCRQEDSAYPWIWYTWGGPDRQLDCMKHRFSRMRAAHHFYFSTRDEQILARRPQHTDHARHTQGMPTAPVVQHLAKLLKKQSR